MAALKPNYKDYRFPQIKPIPWKKVFRSITPEEAINFVSRLLVYDPKARPNPLEALLDPYFDELRDQNTRLPTGYPIPDLFKFTQEEIGTMVPGLHERLVPAWYKASKT